MNPARQKQSRLAALAAAGFLFALVLAVFLPAVQNDFVGYDDPEYVTGNPRVQEGLNMQTVRWAFGATAASNWHPITWVSHMIDYQLFGLNPSGHHFTSLLLHAFNATLLFVILRRFTGTGVLSFLVAALFGLHPLRVESVAWVSERKDVLSGLFFLLTIWAYGRYAESVKWQVGGGKSEIRNPKLETSPKSEARNTSRSLALQAPRLYALSLVLFALGLMSKPMLVTLPFVLLLVDYWPLRRWASTECGQGCPYSDFRSLLLEKLPFAVLAMAASVITYIVQKQAGAVVTGTPVLIRFENAVLSYGRYLARLVWPANLAPFYPFPSHFSVATVIITGAMLLLATAAAVKLRQKIPAVPIGWLWYLGMLVPVIGVVQAGEQAMADRYSYLPSIGVLIAIVWIIHELVKSHAALKQMAIGCALAGMVACTVVTHKQIAVWKNSETLFAHTIRVTHNNYLAHNDLGATFEKQGRFEEAKTELQAAIREKPDYAEAHDNLGVVLQKKGELNQAMNCYSNALAFVPDFAPAHNHLGLALAAQNRLEPAVQHYEEAIKKRPDYADAHFNLALALAHLGRIDESIAEYRHSLEVTPRSADAHNNLGTMLDRKGDLPSAIQEYQSAIRLKPDYARAHLNLGMALARIGRVQEAIFEVQEALRLRPDFPEARQSLGALLEMQKTK